MALLLGSPGCLGRREPTSDRHVLPLGRIVECEQVRAENGWKILHCRPASCRWSICEALQQGVVGSFRNAECAIFVS